ncbi:hypothetical protein [Myroides fluvii]|uniref:hypothetical protein n=1 Tax=Myroides fluvii TaxID=2572594 RepID=UPI00131E152F|nr:hypothetical protein [Myroides fluvii]
MNKENIYKKIYHIATELSKKDLTFTRADLAFELKEFGIDGDSFEISKLVWQTYERYNADQKINLSFLNNEESKHLIDEYKVYHNIELGNQDKVVQVIMDVSKKVKDEYVKLTHSLGEQTADLSGNRESLSWMLLKGTNELGHVSDKARVLYGQYSRMIFDYEQFRNSVKDVISQYVSLRDDVAVLYRDYSMNLIDIFGDSIKQIAPNVFDFEKIQFLNTHQMLSEINTEYARIATSCGVLMGEIGDSFKHTLTKVASHLGKAKGNKAMLLLSVVDMVGHYTDAQEKTLILKNEFEVFKNKIQYDVALVGGDMRRLIAIYRVIEELYVPKAYTFYQYAKQVMDKELIGIISSVYSTPELKELKAERDVLLEEFNYLGIRIKDTQMNSFNYKEEITRNNSLIEDGKSEYELAIASKPSKPILFFLGIGKNSYNRAVYEWKNTCSAVIDSYELSKLKLKLDSDELIHNLELLKKDTLRYNELTLQLKLNQKEVAKNMQVDRALKLQLLAHLESYVKLLRIAKDIVDSKLDYQLVTPTQIEKYKSEVLPTEIQERLNEFTTRLKEELLIDEEEAQFDMMSMNKDEFADDTMTRIINKQEQDVTVKYEKETVVTMMHAQNRLVNSGIDIFNQWVRLQTNKKIGENQKESYEEQLNLIQNKFKEDMKGIDNKGVVLRGVIQKINASDNPKEWKEGLLMLGELSDEKFTIKDIEDILKGNKIIEI